MFKKVLIANRGEIAVRIIRACKDLGIPSAVVYSEADSDSLHVRLAEEAHFIGPSPANESYLSVQNILSAARFAGADAIHPGYGFLSENGAFSEACTHAGLVFIGPSTSSLRLMGDKVSSRRLAQEAQVPVIPGTTTPTRSISSALRAGRDIGFPVMVKASAGGGGKGLRVVSQEEDLDGALKIASSEAESSFKDSSLYLEKFLIRPRHVEVQVLGDRQGNLIHLGERECSTQRRHQKLIEESPSPVVTPELRSQLGAAALAVARAAGYYNAGTIEFLLEKDSTDKWRYYFLEMNTRLQVEHPVTELVTGIDLVREQIRIAAGEPLELDQDSVQIEGSAIECRIYAEDPDNGFLPTPGIIQGLLEPGGPGIRVDSGVYQGFKIPVDYDPLISKVTAYGQTRREALARMRRALAEYRIAGITTTIPFFRSLLKNPRFVQGKLDTGLVDEMLSHKGHLEEQSPEVLPIIAAAIHCFLRDKENRPDGLDIRNAWKVYGLRSALKKDWRQS